MNIEEFFELSAGKWFSHRTSHHLAFNQSKSGKSNNVIEMLAADHPQVIKLCEQYKIDRNLVSRAAKVTWNGTIEKEEKNHSGSTVLVLVPNKDNPNEGKLLRDMVVGSYKMGDDDALTLITEYETMSSEERVWFASPNLRMRVSVQKYLGGLSVASFISEIRMGAAPAKASQAANSASS